MPAGSGIVNVASEAHKVGEILKPFFLTPADGAATAIYLATAEAISHISGGYFYKCRIAKSSKRSKSRRTARKLYELSEEMVKTGQRSQ